MAIHKVYKTDPTYESLGEGMQPGPIMNTALFYTLYLVLFVSFLAFARGVYRWGFARRVLLARE